MPAAAKIAGHYRKLESEISVPQRAPGVVEGDARDMPLYIRGSHKQPGETVPRRFLEAFDAKPFDTKQSGRLELSEAMLRTNNTLVARVIVNRVWHHLFGQGLVTTPDNFGKLGTQPTHPKLLDYLATLFVKEGWSLKKLIRELVLPAPFNWTQRVLFPHAKRIRVIAFSLEHIYTGWKQNPFVMPCYWPADLWHVIHSADPMRLTPIGGAFMCALLETTWTHS